MSEYVSTVYGILPVTTWEIYRAMTLREEAEELHRYVRLTERAGTSEAITDITPDVF